MNSFYAKVIADSINSSGNRLISIEARYCRFIHCEIMTHRDRARNAASSRAIPWKRTIDGTLVKNCSYSMLKDDYFVPLFLGAEQKGMQSGSELTEINRNLAIDLIKEMHDFCLDRCDKLHLLGLHKSIINRYMEPWSYITILMTATEWKNFFRLRIHPAAEKHFNLIASLIKEAIDKSKPKLVNSGEWHLPYILESELTKINLDLKKISAARCARLSYLNQDNIVDYDSDLALFDRLIKRDLDSTDPIHASPLEHVARPYLGHYSGPFNGWFQFRKEFTNENVPG